jgi:hypothetical protein
MVYGVGWARECSGCQKAMAKPACLKDSLKTAIGAGIVFQSAQRRPQCASAASASKKHEGLASNAIHVSWDDADVAAGHITSSRQAERRAFTPPQALQ